MTDLLPTQQRPYRARPRAHPRCHPSWPCKKITKLRESKGHTREAMALMLGVDLRTAYRWELGECPADDAKMRLYELDLGP